MITNDLIQLIQDHVPQQPWGSHGHNPVPVEIYFDHHHTAAHTWTVRFVRGTKGSRRVWGLAFGSTLQGALENARAMQQA